MHSAASHLYVEVESGDRRRPIQKAWMWLWRSLLAIGFGAPVDWTAILFIRRRHDDAAIYKDTRFAAWAEAYELQKTMQRDLDNLTLSEFCEKYGIDPSLSPIEV